MAYGATVGADVAFALLEGREELYLSHIFETYAYDRDAVRRDRMSIYVDAMRNVGALRAGLGYYEAYFKTAEQNQRHAEMKLQMPVLAYGGEACLGSLTKQCLELAADNVAGGIIDRCGHWITEELPDFVIERVNAFFSCSAT